MYTNNLQSSDFPIHSQTYLENQRKSNNSFKCELTESFSNRLMCLHSWYLQASQKTKISFIKQLLRSVSKPVLGEILYNALLCLKDSIYSTQTTNSSLYDKRLIDHDRILDKTVLKTVINEDLQWFKSLSDREQYEVLLALIRLGGSGAVTKPVAFYGKHLWDCYKSKIEKKDDDGQKTISKIPSKNKSQILAEKESGIFAKESKSEMELYILRKSLNLNSESQYNIFTASTQKDWEAKLKAFRESVGLTKSKRQIKAKENDRKLLDYIQLLPIWINRRIISLLDNESLKAASKVNNYWKKLVQSVIKEKAARLELDKMTKKFKSQTTKQNPRKRTPLKKEKLPFSTTSRTNETKELEPKQSLEATKNKSSARLLNSNLVNWEPCFSNKFSFGKHTVVRIIQDCYNSRVIAVDKNYRYMVSSSTPNTVCAYSLITGMPLHEEVDVTMRVSAIDFDTDRIILGFSNGEIKSYSFRVFKFLIAYPGHTTPVSCLSIIESTLLSASKEQILMFEISTSLQLFKIVTPEYSVEILKTLPVCPFFFVGLNNGKLNKYLIMNGKLFSTVDAHNGCITAMDMGLFFFATASIDCFVHIWEYESTRNGCLQRLKHESCVTSVCLYDQYIISGCVNGFIHIWNILKGIRLNILKITHNSIPIKQLYCYLNFNRFQIIACLGTQVLILEFNQVVRKAVRKAILNRGTNSVIPEPKHGIETVKQLRGNYRRERLNLLNDRGCVDEYIKEHFNNISGREMAETLFKNCIADLNLQKRCLYIFPRDHPKNKKTFELPCDVKNVPLPNLNNSKIENRFEDKSMLQLYHPYYISL